MSDMFMVYHGDEDDMLFDEPKFFDTASEATNYAAMRLKSPISSGHALTVYRCSALRIFEAENVA